MRAPHPALQELYRQATTPMRFSEAERDARRMIRSFEVESDAGGIAAEALLAPLRADVAFGDALAVVLGHLSEAQQTEPATVAGVRHTAVLPTFQPSVSDRGRGGHALPDRAVDPERHPHLVPLGETSQAHDSAAWRRFAAGAASARPPAAAVAHDAAGGAAARSPGAFAAPVALQRLIDLAHRAGVEDALHRPVEIKGDSEVAKRLAVGEDLSPLTDGRSPRGPSNDRLPIRLQGVLARIEHSVPPAAAAAPKLPRPNSARGQPAGEPRPDPSKLRGANESASDTRASARSADDAMSPPARVAPASALSASVGGFRGLAEVGRSMRAAAARQSSATPARPSATDAPAPSIVAVDPEQIAELLRREAERHGIDLAGLEP